MNFYGKSMGEFKISVDKFGTELQEVIRDYVDCDGYVITSSAFMNFYMSTQQIQS